MRKNIFSYCLGLILAGMTAATVALAQPAGQFVSQPTGQPPGQPNGARGAGFQARFQEIKRTQMGPAIGVNQQTVDRLLQIQARYQPLRQQLIRESKQEFQRLQQVMSHPSPSEQEVKVIWDNIKRKQQEMQELQRRQGEEEEALLTPVQQARYFLYQRSLLKEARSVRRSGPGEESPLIPQGPREIPVSRPVR
ncbi:MAG: hypothetical protein M1438_07680 [Deltaproteobacteria bacterium]|nr:hypothetical protein [Deltaproteobacteria bacterium]